MLFKTIKQLYMTFNMKFKMVFHARFLFFDGGPQNQLPSGKQHQSRSSRLFVATARLLGMSVLLGFLSVSNWHLAPTGNLLFPGHPTNVKRKS